MKFYHSNKLVLFIPSSVITYNKNMVIFTLNRPISIDEKLKLYKLDNISDIQLKLKYRSFNTDNNLTALHDNIYKFHLINDDNENIYKKKTYYLSYHKFLTVNQYTANITSNWFLNNL